MGNQRPRGSGRPRSGAERRSRARPVPRRAWPAAEPERSRMRAGGGRRLQVGHEPSKLRYHATSFLRAFRAVLRGSWGVCISETWETGEGAGKTGRSGFAVVGRRAVGQPVAERGHGARHPPFLEDLKGHGSHATFGLGFAAPLEQPALEIVGLRVVLDDAPEEMALHPEPDRVPSGVPLATFAPPLRRLHVAEQLATMTKPWAAA